MRRFRRRCGGLLVVVCCLAGGGAPRLFAAPTGDSTDLSGASLNACERAGIAAEQATGLPSGLLLAIGRVESGRWDRARGRVTAWPWTINAAGKGQWFDTEDAASLTVRSALNSGTRSIDVGCFQISLLWHPTAFASLEQAFDPDANARYAARFLLGLFSQTGSWEAAVEAYHSADPVLGYAYRKQVFATWSGAAPIMPARSQIGLPAVASRPAAVAIPVVTAGVSIWTPMPFGTAPEVVAMPGSPAAPPAAGAGPAPLPVVLYRRMPVGLDRRMPVGLDRMPVEDRGPSVVSPPAVPVALPRTAMLPATLMPRR